MTASSLRAGARMRRTADLLHPTIRAVMERGAISTADAKQQVDSFVRVAAPSSSVQLTDKQRDYALIKGLPSSIASDFSNDAQETTLPSLECVGLRLSDNSLISPPPAQHRSRLSVCRME